MLPILPLLCLLRSSLAQYHNVIPLAFAPPISHTDTATYTITLRRTSRRRYPRFFFKRFLALSQHWGNIYWPIEPLPASGNVSIAWLRWVARLSLCISLRWSTVSATFYFVGTFLQSTRLSRIYYARMRECPTRAPYHPNIVAFLCDWPSSRFASSDRPALPTSLRLIRPRD